MCVYTILLHAILNINFIVCMSQEILGVKLHGDSLMSFILVFDNGIVYQSIIVYLE